MVFASLTGYVAVCDGRLLIRPFLSPVSNVGKRFLWKHFVDTRLA
jgi:hypothetical protein